MSLGTDIFPKLYTKFTIVAPDLLYTRPKYQRITSSVRYERGRYNIMSAQRRDRGYTI